MGLQRVGHNWETLTFHFLELYIIQFKHYLLPYFIDSDSHGCKGTIILYITVKAEAVPKPLS